MILEVHERMQLLQLIPQEGGYEALKTWRQQREMLSFSPEEIELLQLHSVQLGGGGVRTEWDNSKANLVVKDVPIPQFCHSHYAKRLSEIDKEGKLNEQMLSLYEKFVILGFK